MQIISSHSAASRSVRAISRPDSQQHISMYTRRVSPLFRCWWNAWNRVGSVFHTVKNPFPWPMKPRDVCIRRFLSYPATIGRRAFKGSFRKPTRNGSHGERRLQISEISHFPRSDMFKLECSPIPYTRDLGCIERGPGLRLDGILVVGQRLL